MGACEIPPPVARVMNWNAKSVLPGYAGLRATSGTLTSTRRGTRAIKR